MQRRCRDLALGIAVSALAAILLVALPTRALARPHPPATSAEFTVPASNGYTIHVKSEDGQLTLLAFREVSPVARASDADRFLPDDEGDYSAAKYYARAIGGPEAFAADLDALGRVDVAFQPSGAVRVARLSQKGKTTDCVFPRRIVRRLGTFSGTISFHGENGYTAIDLTSASGSVGTSPFRNCSTRFTVRPEGVYGQAGPDVFLESSDHDTHTYFSASTLGPGSGFYAASATVLPGGITVIRSAQARASGALAFDPTDGQIVTFRPPAPFSGEATFRRGAARPLRGSLVAAFPGLTVPLTGPSFKARLRLSE